MVFENTCITYTPIYRRKTSMIEILQEHIREKIPIMYIFYGCYNIDQTIEGPYLSYNYVILTLSPGIRDHKTAFGQVSVDGCYQNAFRNLNNENFHCLGSYSRYTTEPS